MQFSNMCMELEGFILSEVTQKKKQVHNDLTPMWDIKK